MLKRGEKYVHYKNGRTYEVVCVAHNATGESPSECEPLVVYKESYGTKTWVRPVSQFLGLASVAAGDAVFRFKPAARKSK